LKILIRNGRVVDPATATDGVRDVLIAEGRIAEVGAGLSAPGARVVEAEGLVVAPGFIDMHVHLREPGQTDKETIASGARAAARGGFTSVCAMPNTIPVNDSPAVTDRIKARAAKGAIVHVHPVAALSPGQRGAELTDMAALAAAGAVLFSDDGRCLQSAKLMRKALETARDIGVLISDHCEDAGLFEGGVMHEGDVSSRLGWPGIPAEAEDLMVARDIILAESLGAPVHIAHLSTRGSAALVRAAKARGVRVSAEATPHHLVLTDEAVAGRDPRFKVNPPLRSADHVEALLEAVVDGTIDVFATDHAPHTVAEKSGAFAAAPFGMVGLETAVAVLLDRLVRPGRITLPTLVRMCATRPAELLGWASRGRLSPGAEADLTLLDLEAERTVRSSEFASRARNTPFEGWALRGGPVMTIVAGAIVHPFAQEQP
jgi:dihydroorotase